VQDLYPTQLALSRDKNNEIKILKYIRESGRDFTTQSPKKQQLFTKPQQNTHHIYNLRIQRVLKQTTRSFQQSI